ncbi:MAG TPA: DJ-1/PfpI family protein [Dyella sp.]|uniref:DJ-1/PfpI family protein n=1 Tax=Dyella sp. TaxID=1869338 RepID=UPI002D76B0EB|nr:DJ-1/PfpI family protein [Dyella sp.]HET6554071.1 DJ-1/PfpI family protein [Dyella sp.]
MRDTVYFLAFDGFADWHAAHALCEIRRPGEWQLRTVGFSMQPALSMGGLRVVPELTLEELDLQRAALLIVPGGYLWEHGHGDEAVDAARRVHAAGAPVAAIDSGVLVLARAGLLDACRHTGSWPGHIGTHVRAYAGADQYDPNVLAVSDGGVITASQLGCVEFAREVIHTLDLYSPSDREHWYRLFKHALPPPWCASDAATAVAA